MSTPDPKLSPVVALDIDGVIRIRDGEDVPGAFPAEITFRRDEYPDLFHGKPRFNEEGLSTGTDWFSGVGAEWVRGLIADGVEVVLATTWQRWANTYFGPVLGLPELPVAVRTLEPDNLNWHHCSPAWKSAQLAKQFNGRPLMWVDDNPWDRPGENLIENRNPSDRALTYFHHTVFWAGIQNEDVTDMNEWLKLASTPEGHTELRRRRRRKMEQDAASRRAWQRNWDARYGRRR